MCEWCCNYTRLRSSDLAFKTFLFKFATDLRFSYGSRLTRLKGNTGEFEKSKNSGAVPATVIHD
jgi:hypothetical protein